MAIIESKLNKLNTICQYRDNLENIYCIICIKLRAE